MSINRKSLKPYSALGKGAGPSLLGTWENELGSTMNITSFNGTTFAGTYSSAVSSGAGPVTGTLAGTLAGDAIAFTVNWSPAFLSATSWNGLVLTDAESLVIYTLWNLASTPEEGTDYWESIRAGADLFVPIRP